MATDVERLVVQMSADINRLNRGLDQAQNKVNRTATTIEQRFRRMNKNVEQSLSGFGKGLLAGAAGALSGRELLNLADGYRQVQNALKVTGLQGQNLTNVYNQLFEAAQRNAAPINSLVQLYSRLSLVQSQLGISQEQLLDFTDRIALALRVGGTSAAQASGSLLQLSQALGSGVVRAEEFNSIIEGTPTIALAAARGLEEAGGSVAKLRQLVVDGQVPAKAFFDAFIFGSQDLAKQAATSERTFAQSLTLIQNALQDTIGKLSETTGISDALTLALSAVAEQIAAVGRNAGSIGIALQSLDKWFTTIENSIGAAGRALGEFLGIRDNTLAGQLASGRPRDYGLQSPLPKPGQAKPSLSNYALPPASSSGTGKTQTAEAKEYAEALNLITGEYDRMADASARNAGVQSELNQRWEEGRQLSSTFATDFVSGIRDGESALESLRSALDRLLDTLIKTLTQMAVSGLFNSVGGIGGAGNSGGSLIPGGLFHSGGRAGSATTSRMVNPAVFAGAPRYHSGGVAGIKSGEVPAILQRGEIVVPNARGGKRSGGPLVNVNVINNSDARVRTESKDDGRGGVDLMVAIDQATAKNMGRQGSQTQKTLASFGGAPVPNRR